MYYTRITVTCDAEAAPILIAEMSEIGFDTFQETEHGFEAYAEQDHYDKTRLADIKKRYAHLNAHYAADTIARKNWNEEWEKNYEPINIEDTCLVRAEFHQPDKVYPYEIIITPKMSFGTGHHQTTYLMIKNQLRIDHHRKQVIDAGCGTAILSIMAAKLGADHVEAFDIDEWSVINGQENIDINNCPSITIRQGKISELTFVHNADIILANINRNILLEEMPLYAARLKPGGKLLLSGFYEKDIPVLIEKASSLRLTEVGRDSRETWACLLLSLT